ncbi:MAG: sigma-54 dependent transcriptional regulator [Desulfobacteraceae bacterium]
MVDANNSSDRKASVLIIDDEDNMRHMLSKMLAMENYHVETAADGQQGLIKLGQSDFDFILCDIQMPKMDGMEFLTASKDDLQHATIIMMSAYGTIDLAVKAMQLGAYDFISKPFKSDEVRLAIQKAQERDKLKRENIRLKARLQNFEERQRFGKLVAKSAAMKSVFAMASKAAQYSTTVLITGESGTGKELISRAIHYEGKRCDHSMVPVNCGSIPENLLESELFGYVKGAFTGADGTKKGLFEEAHKGTIFLDEIGELSLPLQVKLLRVLQENEIRPLGTSHTQKIDVRVIAATSRNLEEMVAEKTFREDLYYRLNVFPVEMPPLRDRSEDIPLLCNHFIKKFNKSLGSNVKTIAPEAMAHLLQHHWPGNVRELENAIERAMVLSGGNTLKKESIFFTSSRKSIPVPLYQVFEGYSIKNAQKILEEDMITRALRKTKGNRTQAAKLLEISHPSLLSKMKMYKIDL